VDPNSLVLTIRWTLSEHILRKFEVITTIVYQIMLNYSMPGAKIQHFLV